MGISVNRIPSISVPFTTSEGRINPVWYEFLRLFVASTDSETEDGEATAVAITAGAGLTGGGVLSEDRTINVGAGSGIAVNADDVSVDIVNQANTQASLDDEVLVADVSDNNTIKKTKVRSLIELSSPGGSNTHVQYNDNGIFGGDSNFTYNKAGTISVNGINSVATNGNLTVTPNGTGLVVISGTNKAITHSAGSATSSCLSLNSNVVILYGGSSTSFIAQAATGWNIQSAASKTLQVSSSSGVLISGMDVTVNTANHIFRSINAAITASTTQTQGQGALTRDYNNVTTVANNNDTVTLPGAADAKLCLVVNSGANILQVFPESGDNLGAGLNTAITLRPGEHALWVASSITLWHQISGVMKNSVASGITASTTQTQGQQPLTKDVNEISVVANANDTVTLPSAPAYSRTVTIINNGANTLQIFPASGDNLGAGVDTSTTLASGSNVRYTNYDATNWEAI